MIGVLLVFLGVLLTFRATRKYIDKVDARIKRIESLNDGFCSMLDQYIKEIDRMTALADEWNRRRNEGEEWKEG